jgi:hypothetical protein
MIGRLVRAAAFAAAATAAYVAVIRPWHLRWGTKGDEIERPMPGDDLIILPRVRATHGITIRARSADVYPWLLEMSRLRGLVGAEGAPGGEEAHVRDLAVGDSIDVGPDMSMTVVHVDAPTALAFRMTFDPMTGRNVARADASAKAWVDATWSFELDETDDGGEWSTRLVARFRADYSPLWWAHALAYGGLEPGQFAMDRQLLTAIRDRAERGGPAQFGAEAAPAA